MWESQVLLTDGQVVFLRVLRFSPTFDNDWLDISEIFLKGPLNPNQKKKKKKKMRKMVKLLANSEDPDQTLHSAAFDLGLH